MNDTERATCCESPPGAAPVDLGPFCGNQIYQLDCIEGLQQLPDNSFDLAIADPPYNASKGGNWSWDNSVPLPGFGGKWDKVMAEWDDLPLADYVGFSLAWLRQLQRVVRPSGSLWVHGTYHNIGILNFCMQLLRLEIINEVIWYKRNSFPNLSGRRLTASHETILWAHTGKQRQYYFNYELAKEMECPEDGLKKPGKQLRTVWDIPNNKQRSELAHGRHPTQKPLRLLKRMLELSAWPGSWVLSPFAGAGSDCVAARQFGTNFLGFEVDAKFVEVSRQRLQQREKDGDVATRSINRRTRGHTKSDRKHQAKVTVPSLIKWTGSKRAQAAQIVQLIPNCLRYYEPFVGGGAVLYLANRADSLASDLYRPLIQFWKLVQNDPAMLIENYHLQWHALQQELDLLAGQVAKPRSGTPRYFYEVRARFNESQNPLDLNFLMRTCVNGIVRFNACGHFNNSFHLSRRGMRPAKFEKIVDKWRRRIGNVRFACLDYEEAVADARAGDFVYFDPPYAGNRQRYIEDLNLARFFQVLDRLNARGVRWALSFDGSRGDADLTHDVPTDLFRRQLYLAGGNSAVHKVLNGPIEAVCESLYLNY